MGTGGDSLLHFLLPLAIGFATLLMRSHPQRCCCWCMSPRFTPLDRGLLFGFFLVNFSSVSGFTWDSFGDPWYLARKSTLWLDVQIFFNPFKELAKCGSATVSSPHHLLTISTGSGFAAWVGCKEVLSLYYSISLHLAQPSHILLEVDKKELAPPSALCVEFSQEHI